MPAALLNLTVLLATLATISAHGPPPRMAPMHVHRFYYNPSRFPQMSTDRRHPKPPSIVRMFMGPARRAAKRAGLINQDGTVDMQKLQNFFDKQSDEDQARVEGCLNKTSSNSQNASFQVFLDFAGCYIKSNAERCDEEKNKTIDLVGKKLRALTKPCSNLTITDEGQSVISECVMGISLDLLREGTDDFCRNEPSRSEMFTDGSSARYPRHSTFWTHKRGKRQANGGGSVESDMSECIATGFGFYNGRRVDVDAFKGFIDTNFTEWTDENKSEQEALQSAADACGDGSTELQPFLACYSRALRDVCGRGGQLTEVIGILQSRDAFDADDVEKMLTTMQRVGRRGPNIQALTSRRATNSMRPQWYKNG